MTGKVEASRGIAASSSRWETGTAVCYNPCRSASAARRRALLEPGLIVDIRRPSQLGSGRGSDSSSSALGNRDKNGDCRIMRMGGMGSDILRRRYLENDPELDELYAVSELTDWVPLEQVYFKVQICDSAKEHAETLEHLPSEQQVRKLGRDEYQLVFWCDQLVKVEDSQEEFVQICWSEFTRSVPTGKHHFTTLLGLQESQKKTQLMESQQPVSSPKPARQPFSEQQDQSPTSSRYIQVRASSPTPNVRVTRSASSKRVASSQMEEPSLKRPRRDVTVQVTPTKAASAATFETPSTSSPTKDSLNFSVASKSTEATEVESVAEPTPSKRKAAEELEEATPPKRGGGKSRIDVLASATSTSSDASADSSPTKSPSVRAAKNKSIKSAIHKNVRSVKHPTHLATAAFEEEEARNILAKLGERNLANATPLQKAKYLLHVGSTPSFLPCREKEFSEIMEKVENAVDEGIGQCLYISGVPGTGKTATVRQVIRTLERKRALASKKPGAPAPKDFNYVEINGMKIGDASQVYSILWNALDGAKHSNMADEVSDSGDESDPLSGSKQRVRGSRSALEKLRQHFDKFAKKKANTKAAERKMTVLMLDEMDQLITAKQDVIYNLFNWPNTQNSRLVVIALANTMDLPQRALTQKVASRLGWQSVTFTPYTHQQLKQIVKSRLGISTPEFPVSEKTKALTAGCETLFDEGAISLMAMKVGNVNGDARRMLDIARRALEKLEEEAPESRLRNGNARNLGSVKPAHVTAVITDMAQSGKTKHIGALSMHAKLLLWSTIACIRKTGLMEVSFEEMHAHHVALVNNHRFGLASIERTPRFEITHEALQRPLATLCSLGLLVAAGSGFGSAYAGMHSRYLLGVREDEVRFALREDKDERFKSLT